MKLTTSQKQALAREILNKFQNKRKNVILTADEQTAIEKFSSEFKTLLDKQAKLTSDLKAFLGIAKGAWIGHVYEASKIKELLINKKIKIPSGAEILHQMELMSIGEVKTIDSFIDAVMSKFNGSKEDSKKTTSQKNTTKKTPVKKAAAKKASSKTQKTNK